MRRGIGRREASSLGVTAMMLSVLPHGKVVAQAAGIEQAVATVEARLSARVGVSVIDTPNGTEWAHRGSERFPLTSTFKAFACAAVLKRVDSGTERLDRRIPVRAADLVTYSPVVEKHVAEGAMSLADLCVAATALSDNAAGNFVLDSIGGPAGLTAFMRSIGDSETRLDRRETELNEATPGDPRDTTTPSAAAASLRKLVLGDVLSAASRDQLERWLAGNQVGGPLLRAGLPNDWRIADRTGAGGHGSRSIIAMIRPPQRAPLAVAIYITGTEASLEQRNQAIAEIGRALVQMFNRTEKP